MATICWRFDDLNFAKEGELCSSLSLQKKMASVLDMYGCKATFGVITRYNNNGYHENKPYFMFIKQLQRRGHEIAAHGVYHGLWTKYTEREIAEIARTMREDFDEMRLYPRTFIFPGLQTNWKALPVLRKYGFDIIIKGENFNPLKRAYVVLRNCRYRKEYGLNFFIPHTFNTAEDNSYKSVKLPDINAVRKELVHVMDHLFMYREKDIRNFEGIVKSSRKYFEWRTISSAAEKTV